MKLRVRLVFLVLLSSGMIRAESAQSEDHADAASSNR